MDDDFDDETETAPRSSTPRRMEQGGNETLSFIPVHEVRDLIPQTEVVDHVGNPAPASRQLPVEDVIPAFNKFILGMQQMQQMQSTITQIVNERGTFVLKDGTRVGKEHVEGLEEALTEAGEKLKTLEQENERLSGELAQSKADQDSQTAAYHDHLRQTTSSLHQSIKNANDLSSRVTDLESQLLQLKSENQRLKDSNTDLSVEIKDLRVFKDTVVDEMVKRAEERFKEQVTELEKEVANGRLANMALRNKLSVSEREKDKLQLLCQATQQRRQSLNVGLPAGQPPSLPSPSTSSSSQSESQGYRVVLPETGGLITQIHVINGANY